MKLQFPLSDLGSACVLYVGVGWGRRYEGKGELVHAAGRLAGCRLTKAKALCNKNPGGQEKRGMYVCERATLGLRSHTETSKAHATEKGVPHIFALYSGSCFIGTSF